ncbi:MAG: hypothetical protein KA104_01985 [Candidatus Pacebacteria bacterium]|nr:hypothetical protein [Candidatus Paceibacterota bacterium]
MRRTLYIPIIAAIALALVAGVVLFFPQLRNLVSKSGAPTVSDIQVQVPPLTQKYTNDTLRFTFNYSEGYMVREVASETGMSVLIEDQVSGKGVQIYVTPYADSDTTITQERVENEVGDMSVIDPQPIVLSAGGGEGLAFKSDNPDFGGNSREAWFIVGGHLYQISTYAEYDELLQAIFATWTFF